MQNFWSGGNKLGGYPYLVCNHWRQHVLVGRYHVTCSSHSASQRTLLPPPDYGIYLDTIWRDKLGDIWTNGAYLKRVADRRPYPALVLDWHDMGTVGVEVITQLVEICLSKMRHGLIPDIGCAHGHGRTGCLLACLIARVEHLGGDEAIRAARQRYCRYAVEAKAQEDLVRRYAGGKPWRRR